MFLDSGQISDVFVISRFEGCRIGNRTIFASPDAEAGKGSIIEFTIVVNLTPTESGFIKALPRGVVVTVT
jgi:hypothetical protein